MIGSRPQLNAVLLSVALSVAAAGEEWVRFRGPNGSGVVDDAEYPERLDPAQNLAWKSAARAGKSSPVLTDERIFITAFAGEKLYTQCFNRRTGKLLWERAVPRTRKADLNQLNEPAAISPVTDGENVYVFFRDFGLLSYDGEGNLRWKAPLDPFANSMGHSSSPVIAADVLVIQADQKFGSYIAAFDLANGETRWKIPRQDGESWSTPLFQNPTDEAPQILTTSRGWVAGHSLADGRLLWRNDAFPPAVVASPVLSGRTVYAFAYGNAADSNFERSFKNRDGDGDGLLTAEEYGGSAFMAGIAKYDGDRDGVLSLEEFLTAAGATIAPSSLVAWRFAKDAEPRELWRYERSFVGVIPSPLVYRGVVYLIKNGGIFERLDAETGAVIQRGRIREGVDGYSSSPVAGGGKVYVASESGKVTVLDADRDWSTVSVNDLAEPIFATPALSRGQVFVRTEEHLYCFGQASEVLSQ